MNFSILFLISFVLRNILSTALNTPVYEFRPNEIRYFSNFYDTYSDSSLRALALGSNQYSLSCWIKFSNFPSINKTAILFHLTLLGNSLEPSDYTNIPYSYQHLSNLILVDIHNDIGVPTMRGYSSYFGTPQQTVFTNTDIVSGNWYFIYAGSDQINKVYTIGFFTAGLKDFQTVIPVTGLTTDGNEQLDSRLTIYFGGSKGVPYGINEAFNGYLVSPKFYINYYTSSYPEYLMFGEATKSYYFHLNGPSKSFIKDRWGSYSQISFGSTNTNLESDDPIFTESLGLQFSTGSATFMTISNQFSFENFNYFSFWIYLGTSPAADLSIFTILNTNSDVVFELFYEGVTGKIKFKCLTTPTVNGLSVSLNTWNHMVIVFSSSIFFSEIYFSLFLNGVDKYPEFLTNFIPITPPDSNLPNQFYFGKISADSSFTGNIIDLITGHGARIMITPPSIPYCQLSIGIENLICLYCNSLAYSYNGSCVLTCPQGSYVDSTTKACRFCSPLCKECTGPQDSACISCKTPSPYLFGSRCFSNCPFGSISSSDNTCSCDPSCQECTYDSTSSMVLCQNCLNPSHFIKDGYLCVDSNYCPYNYFGNQVASHSCSLTCPLGTFQNFAERVCTSYCTTRSIKFFDSFTQACYNECPASYFNSTITATSGFQNDQTIFQCSSCVSPCLTCNQAHCLTCIPGYLYYENNGTCNTICTDGYFQEAMICRVCRDNCSICPYNFYLYNNTCLDSCPIGTTQLNSSCINNNYAIVNILNKTNGDTLTVTRQNNLNLLVDYIYIEGDIDSITWSLYGISSIYSSEFFSSAYTNLKTLSIPKINLRGNIQYNVSVSVSVKGNNRQDHILIKTYPDIDIGVFLLSPSSGVSGIDTFTVSLLLWNTSQNLSISLFSYNKVVVNLSQNQTIFGKYNPELIFDNISTNGNYSFVPRAILDTSNITFELVVSNFDTTYRKNITVLLSPYNGDPQLKSDLWRVNYTALITLNDIYSTAYSLFIVYGVAYSKSYQKDLAIAVYKAAKQLNQNSSYYCNDLIHCHGNGVCQQNSINSKTYSCKCFNGFAGENCYWDSRDYQLLTNYTMTLMLNLRNINISTISTLTYLKCLKTFLDLKDLLPKNGIILAIISLQNILKLENLSLESLILVVENIGLCNYHLFLSTSFQLVEQKKYTKVINKLMDNCLNKTEAKLVIGQDYFISSKFVDIFLSKKPKFSLLSSSMNSDSYFIIALSKIHFYIPNEALSIEDIVTVRAIQWKTNFEDISSNDYDISFKGEIQLKFANIITPIENLTNPILIYMSKTVNYEPIIDINDGKIPYSCGYFDEDLYEFSKEGCQFMNESNSFILCNCSHFSTFSAQIIKENITYPPSLSTLINDNNLESSNVSISSLLKIDFVENLLSNRYTPSSKKIGDNEIDWNNPGMWVVIPSFLLYLLSCLLNIKNWKKNRFEQIMNENKPIIILTYHPFVSLSIKAHSEISHTQQMRLTKLFLTYFSNLFGSALLYTELDKINSKIELNNRVIGAIIIGLIVGYIFHYMIEWLYKGIFLQFLYTKSKRNSLFYHLMCWSFMILFGILTIYEIGKLKEDDCIYWIYVIFIMFGIDILIIYTLFLIYPFWTSNKGYLVPALKYMGFYIVYQNDLFQLPLNDINEEKLGFHSDTIFPQNSSKKIEEI